MKQFRFLDNIKTPEDWKRRALEINETERPKLKGWQYGTVVAVAAVAAISAGILPNVINKGGITSSPASYTDDALTDEESIAQDIQEDLVAQLEQNYEEVLVGTVVYADRDADGKQTLELVVPDFELDGYKGDMMIEAIATEKMSKLGFDVYDSDLKLGDKVAIGLEEMRNGIKIKTKTSTGTYTERYDAYECLREFSSIAYLGKTDDANFIRTLEKVKAAANDEYSYADPRVMLLPSIFIGESNVFTTRAGNNEISKNQRIAAMLMNNYALLDLNFVEGSGANYSNDDFTVKSDSKPIVDIEDPEFNADSIFYFVPQLFTVEITSKNGSIDDISFEVDRNGDIADIEMNIDGKVLYAQASLNNFSKAVDFSRIRFVKDTDDDTKAYLLIDVATLDASDPEANGGSLNLKISDKPFAADDLSTDGE